MPNKLCLKQSVCYQKNFPFALISCKCRFQSQFCFPAHSSYALLKVNALFLGSSHCLMPGNKEAQKSTSWVKNNLTTLVKDFTYSPHDFLVRSVQRKVSLLKGKQNSITYSSDSCCSSFALTVEEILKNLTSILESQNVLIWKGP